ncbi:phasin family protein [Thermomonas sp.]|uniref:phasin family protein n=1 Tax=Thermomonas sp. TaxID=1971895 RepID=UPI002489204F|nr:phasin family protein [Thermomonas sp.]MDI1253473.1 phasin family protein [Thermomonas sp.]
MAKLKKTARKSATGTAKGSTAKESQAQAERLGKSITESAQQIWLAGMGAFNRAQAEGGKLFESLVRDGLSLEQTARKFAGNRADVVRDLVEDRVGQAKERAADTWDKLESVFEDRVQRALVKLGVPSRADLNTLTERVERLTAELRKANGKPAATSASKRAKASKAPRKSATKAAPKAAPKPKAAAKAPAKKARKSAAKKTAAAE